MAEVSVWAVTPATSATAISVAATAAGAGNLTLVTNTVGYNGTGYKLLATTAGNSSNRTITITGRKVGDTATSTETMTLPNTSTLASTNYWGYVDSIAISGASTGNVSIGTTGDLALPRTRVRGVYFVAGASAGTIKVAANSTTGTLLLQINTPAGATLTDNVILPSGGVLTAKGTGADFAVVTLTNTAFATLICG